MVILEKLCLFFILTHQSAGLWMAEKKEYFEELAARCVGAVDEYYVDDQARRCCKCSNCTGFMSRRIPECNPKSNCEAIDYDCVYEEDFCSVFPHSSCHGTKTTQFFPKPTQSPTVTTTVALPSSNPAEPDGGMGPVVMSVAAVAVATSAVVIAVILLKCTRTGGSSLNRLLYLCKPKKQSSPDSHNFTESSREEGACLVKEGGDAANQAPPRAPRLSGFGPHEMLLNQYPRISHRNEISSGSFSDPISISSSVSQGNNINTLAEVAHSIHAPVPACASHNSGTVISGNDDVIFSPTNGGNVHWNQPKITIIYGHNPTSMAAVDSALAHVSSGVSRAQSNGTQGSYPNGEGLPRSFPSVPESNRDCDVRRNECFAVGNHGVCVTSASPPMSQQGDEHRGAMRRQSSQISSTSSGPVENSAADLQSGKSYPKEVSVSQESDYSATQEQSSALSGIQTSSIPSMHMSSRLNGPVQHSSGSSSGRLLNCNTSDGHQPSIGDGMSFRTETTYSPRADVA